MRETHASPLHSFTHHDIPMTAERPLLTELPIKVKTYDIDYLGIAHNMVYIRWLEDLRTALLEERLPMEELLAAGISPVLVRTEIDYRRPVRIGDRPLGCVWVENLSHTRWTVATEILVEGQVAAASKQKGYFVELETMRPVRVPQPLRDLWEQAR